MSRTEYTLKQAWAHRAKLASLKHSNQERITDIDCARLKQNGISELILDFDGVMASHGELTPREDVITWLKGAIKIFGVKHIFILSNKPMAERQAYFERYFTGLRFISGVRKKPYPDGLNAIMAITKKPASQHILVDDRLLTGMLATILAGTKGILITQPYTQFSKRPLHECFFGILRFLERWVF